MVGFLFYPLKSLNSLHKPDLIRLKNQLKTYHQTEALIIFVCQKNLMLKYILPMKKIKLWLIIEALIIQYNLTRGKEFKITNHYITERPLSFSQSFSGLTDKLVSHAPCNVFNSTSNCLAKLIIACISFGKQLPPNPILPSGPGTER